MSWRPCVEVLETRAAPGGPAPAPECGPATPAGPVVNEARFEACPPAPAPPAAPVVNEAWFEAYLQPGRNP
jgi:hypothetical protein